MKATLTVADLLLKLEKADPSLPVHIETEEGYYMPAQYAGATELERYDVDGEPLLDEEGEYVMMPVFAISL